MINRVVELHEVFEYLKKRGLIKQYKKAKNYILNWGLETVLFKKRKPRTSKIYQFRINSKYRAFWYYDDNNDSIFKVIKISDHQD